MTVAAFTQTLDALSAAGRTANLWLRDDDAVVPSPALERLTALTVPRSIPMTLAVIPEETGDELAGQLSGHDRITVAVHGWSHRSYSRPPAKKQELGLDRPLDLVLAELEEGREKLARLYGQQLLPMLVPPWNRVAGPIVEALPALGFTSLSVFGREKTAPLPLLNTHLDIMDWHGTKGGRPSDVLFDALSALVGAEDAPSAIGILTHHLVHDDQAWHFLQELVEATDHPACRWISAAEALSGR